jgi:serine/threonine-protein kinase
MAFQCIRCKAEIGRDFKACPHCGEPVTDFLRRYAEEPVDGKYQLVERLGAGGMGEVYKVHHTFLGATRVIKVIRPQISDNKDAHDRFLREARAATKVQHPNVATLHDFSALPDGSHYMVWEFIDGENLAQRIRARGVLQPRYAVGIAIQALQGLEAIHRAGIVHRDISPENIMITREQDGEEGVKVIDLGVAKTEEPSDNATRAGVFVGKLRYASPEHLGFLSEGERIDGRADLYSLAMVLYEMLTGRPPFEATSPHEYVLLHSREQSFKPLNLPADLPGGSELQAAIAKGLARDRNNRFRSAREFADALREVARSLPDPKTIDTLNVPLDGEATFLQTPLPRTTKPDTLHRETLRSGFGSQEPTVKTPLPSAPIPAPPADATIRTPLPSAPAPQPPPTVIVAKARHGSPVAFLIVGLIVILAAAGIGAVLWLRKSGQPSQPATLTTPATTTVASASQPLATQPEATVDVVTTTPVTTTTGEPAPVLSATTTTQAVVTSPPVTTTTQAPIERPRPVPPPVTETMARQPEPKPQPAPVPPPQPAVRTFVDGDTGDADINDELIENLRRRLIGVTAISVRGPENDQRAQLIRRLENAEITVADGSNTVIDFEGTLEQLGRGRKRRSARASILQNGRVIFRYELPPEEYRVGDTPAEAFSRVVAEAFGGRD